MEKKVKLVRMVPVHNDPIAVPPLKYDELIRQSERLGMIERVIADYEDKGHSVVNIAVLKVVIGFHQKTNVGNNEETDKDDASMYDAEEPYGPSVEKEDEKNA